MKLDEKDCLRPKVSRQIVYTLLAFVSVFNLFVEITIDIKACSVISKKVNNKFPFE